MQSILNLMYSISINNDYKFEMDPMYQLYTYILKKTCGITFSTLFSMLVMNQLSKLLF